MARDCKVLPQFSCILLRDKRNSQLFKMAAFSRSRKRGSQNYKNAPTGVHTLLLPSYRMNWITTKRSIVTNPTKRKCHIRNWANANTALKMLIVISSQVKYYTRFQDSTGSGGIQLVSHNRCQLVSCVPLVGYWFWFCPIVTFTILRGCWGHWSVFISTGFFICVLKCAWFQ